MQAIVLLPHSIPVQAPLTLALPPSTVEIEEVEDADVVYFHPYSVK